jgi:preprotein translocase subunit YajC
MGIFIIILLGVVVYLLLDIKRTMQKRQDRKDSLRTIRKDD